MIYLDTHVVAWLYAGDLDRFSPTAADLLDREPLLISPIVQLELEYLHEIDRVTVGSALILESLGQTLGLSVCDLPFVRVVVESVGETWTRDPFDRLIVAQAKARRARLITKDRSILDRYPGAVW